MFGVGPPAFLGRTMGVAISAFRQLAVDDNAVTRTSDAAEEASAGAWQAIVIASSFIGRGDTSNVATTTIPGVAVLPLQSNMLYLSGFRAELLALVPDSVSVRGNRLRGQTTTAPLVEVDDVVGCLFDQNDGELAGTAAGAAGAPLGRIRCQHVGAANNRLIGISDQVTLQLSTKSFAVLGNLTTGPIQVNGGSLPAPWDALNVHV